MEKGKEGNEGREGKKGRKESWKEPTFRTDHLQAHSVLGGRVGQGNVKEGPINRDPINRDAKVVISQAPGSFQKGKFDTMILSMSPRPQYTQKATKIIKINCFKGSRGGPWG